MVLVAFIIAISALVIVCIVRVKIWCYNRVVKRHKKNVDELLSLPEDQRVANWDRIFGDYRKRG